jgi:hypothetical protein
MWKNVFGFGTVGLGYQRPCLYSLLFSFPNWRIKCGFGLVNAFVLKENIMKTPCHGKLKTNLLLKVS